MKAFHVIILVISVVLITASVIMTFDDLGVRLFGIKWPVHCLMHDLFNVKCAFCGMSRSFAACGHGQFEKAFGYHFFGPVLFVFVAGQIPYRAWILMRWPKKPPEIFEKTITVIGCILIAGIIANWMLYIGGKL